jgi:hypothetical protein
VPGLNNNLFAIKETVFLLDYQVCFHFNHNFKCSQFWQNVLYKYLTNLYLFLQEPQKGVIRLSCQTVAAFLAVGFCPGAYPYNTQTGTLEGLHQTSPQAIAQAQKRLQTVNVNERTVWAAERVVLQGALGPAGWESTVYAAPEEAAAVTLGKFRGVDVGETVVSND